MPFGLGGAAVLVCFSYFPNITWGILAFAAWVLFDRNGAPVGRWGFSLQDIGNASFLSQLEAALARLS